MDAFVVHEKIVKAHLRPILEMADGVIKDMVIVSMSEQGCTKDRQIIKYVRSREYEFWGKLKPMDSLLLYWYTLVCNVLKRSPSMWNAAEFKNQVWEAFMRRLCLDLSLIIADPKCPTPPQGNSLVCHLFDAIDETIYRQFPLSFATATPPPPPAQPQPELRDLFASEPISDTRSFQKQKNPLISTESTRPSFAPKLANIPEDDLVSDTGMKILTPTISANGMSVRLRRNPSTTTNPRRGRKKKASESSSSDSDPE